MMTTDRTSHYAQAVIALAAAEGGLDTVEDELLAVARSVDAAEALRQRLTDTNLPVQQRLAFVESDVLRAAHPATRAALAMLIAAERIGDLASIAEEVAQRAAADRDRELAEVTVAVPLDEASTRKLQRSLERATGKKLELKVHVDSSVVGGVRAKIGDTVIDGSLARRLDDLRSRVGG
jgi:F-type H+-transporting ATPase subunit delta